MNNVFAPGVRFLNQLKYPRKLGLIGLLSVLPFGLVTFFWVGEVNERIAFSAKEQIGNDYLRLVQQFAADLRAHRGWIWVHRGQQSSQEERLRIEMQLQHDIQDIDAADRKYGAILLTTPEWTAIKQSYQTLGDSIGTEVPDPADSENPHTKLIAQVIALMSKIGDHSNLILDPELDSFYLMDLLVHHLPLLTEQIGQARGFNAGLSAQESTSELNAYRRKSLASQIRDYRKTLEHHFDVTFHETEDRELSGILQPAMDRCNSAMAEFLDLIGQTEVHASRSGASSDEVWEKGSKTLAEYDKLYSLTSTALDRLLQARVSALWNRRFLVALVAFACMALVVYLAIAFYLAVMQTVAQLDSASVRLLKSHSDDTNFRVDTNDELGQITRSFGSLAARLNAESNSLRNSERRMRGILDGATDAVVTIDSQGTIESVNPAVERNFGYRPDELLGKNISLLMPLPYRSEHDGYLRRYLETGVKHIIGIGREVMGQRRDGTAFYCDLAVSEIQLDDRRIFTGFLRDISDRKTAEAVLARSNALQRAILEQAAYAIIATTPEGIITTFNPAAERLLGYSAAEMIGRQTPAVFHLEEEVVVRAREFSRELGECIEPGFEVFVAKSRRNILNEHEWTYRRQDGSQVSVLLGITALRNAEGEITGFLGIANDITERKRAEIALERALLEAESANRAKSEFLANMSHEIRTPMNGIVGFTDIVLDSSLTSDQREHLEIVKSSADFLLRIIDDILDFSKIEAGKLELAPYPFRLRDNLGDTVKSFAFRAHEKNLELTWQIHADVPDCLVGDAGRLRQILVNLVGNAIKFTSSGEVGVTVELVSRNESSACLRFIVRDSGIGIPLDRQQQVFEAFSQADSSTTRSYGGTGLGLSISQKLVRMMGGELTLTSEAGRGSTFCFTVELPISHTLPLDAADESDVDLTGIRVLVVDDNATNRRILNELLRGWGMLPSLADGGEAGLEAMRQAHAEGAPFTLVLTDCHMPKMDGFMFVEKLQQQTEIASVTIMMLTSAERQGASERCQQLGIAATLLKPLKQSELKQAIISVLGKFASTTRIAATIPPVSTIASSKSLRVLLAEDNEVNQKVAVRLLQRLGHRVEVVVNGQLALNALQTEQFDVVLMDIQMPVMDGFQTVTAIRKLEQDTGRHQPIIAMTAHALSGDRERCLAAGMDGYVSKPIQLASLVEALSRIAVPADSSSNGELEVEVSDARSAEASLVFDCAAALAKFDGDKDFLEEIIGIFLRCIPDQMASLKTAMEQDELSAVAESAHAIKGGVASLGAAPAYAAALELEHAARQGKVSSLTQAHERLLQEIDRLVRVLKSAIVR